MRSTFALALFFSFAACGGGGGKGSSDPPSEPNSPPSIGVPAGLSGTSPSFGLTVPTGETRTLLFTASDPDGDLLQWQVAANGASLLSSGVSYSAPSFGTAFQIQLAVTTAPAAVNLSILVEDPDGAASAIDVRVVRSGAPVITGITPTSAFTTQAQAVTVTGSALQLGGAVATNVSFDGVQGNNTTIVSDTTITTNTPTSAALGETVVSVANVFGTTSLPAQAFRVHAFPPSLFATDTQLDAGAASSLVLARNRDVVAAAWLEGASLVYRVSNDRGQNWGAPFTVSGAEAASEPSLSIEDAEVMLAWIGDGTSVWVRRSTNGGSAWEAAQRVDPVSPVTEARRPRLAQSGARRHLVWLSGTTSLGTARVRAVASTNGGLTWSSPQLVSDGGQNQANHQVECDGEFVWVLCEDERIAPRAAWAVRSTDGGTTWLPGLRLNSPATSASSPVLTTSANRLFAAWVQNGGLFLTTSADRGATWATTIVELQGAQLGSVSEPVAVCDANQAVFAYIVAGNLVRTSRFTVAGASVQQASVDAATTVSASPVIAQSGNYVFVAWREGDVGSGAARTQFAVSVNGAGAFAAPTGFGDGTAAQSLPVLGVEGAHLFLGWLDARGATSGVFCNRTEF
ncbi:MAG: IPT/TIG domain-containing protein [Planctomycetes bacterium]|nr:IPT/TIG domain-containing protein [Planctomycetota bacterium]